MRLKKLLILAAASLALSGCGSGLKTGIVSPTVSTATVTNVAPAAMSTGVAVNTVITASFSLPLQSSNFQETRFTVTDSNGNAVGGVVAYSADGSSATFTPGALLTKGMAYSATVLINGNTASAYHWSFTTTALPVSTDATVTPISGATDVPVNVSVTATFTRPMNAINGSTFTLTGPYGDAVPGTVSYTVASSIATFTPTKALAFNAQYTAAIAASGDTSGGSRGSMTSWSFTTEGGPMPTVLTTTPTSGSTGTSTNSPLTVSFSDAMNASTLTNSTFTVTGPGRIAVAGSVTYSVANEVATFTPAAPLEQNTTYIATITAGALSAAGTPIANYVWSFTTGAQANLATVDFGRTYQTIRGFGGSNAWLPKFTRQQAAALFSQSDGLGLSILRVRIDPTGNAVNDWVPSNGGWAIELANASEAQAANPNAIVFASPWTPPVSMKKSSTSQAYYAGTDGCGAGQGYCGGYLDPMNYGAYGNYLEAFAKYFQNGGVSLYGISLQNEPDFSNEPGQNWESCAWTADQIKTWIAGYASVITTRLIMPESASFDPAAAAPSLSDPSTERHAAIIGGHLYGATPAYYWAAENANKELWMTEHYLKPAGTQPAIGDALQLATEIHDSMVTAQYNAYVWWSIQNNTFASINYGLIDSDANNPSATYYGYALGQFARFVQPGYVRASATASPSDSVLISAYASSAAGPRHYVIVAINTGMGAVTLPFTIQNAKVTELTPYQTTAAGGLVQQGVVGTSQGNFIYTLPPQSITTFVQ